MGPRLLRRRLLLALALAAGALLTLGPAPAFGAKYAVFAVNDLGMHCYQRSYAGFMILPPANNLKVQVFRKGAEGARPVTSGIRISYVILNNTRSSTKTDFWKYASSYGYPGLKANVGITGHGLSGRLKRVPGTTYWEVTAIPITPYKDNLTFDPLQVAKITVQDVRTKKVIAVQPKVVVPGLGRDALRTVSRPGGHRRQHPAGARRRQRDPPVRRPAGRRPPRLQRVPQGQRPGQARRRRRQAALAGHPRVPRRQDGRAGRRGPRHAVLRVSPRRPDEVPARPYGAGRLHLHQRRLPRRYGAGRRQPGPADEPRGLAAGADVRRLPRREVRGEPGAALPQLLPRQRPRGHERQDDPVRVVPRQPARGVAVDQVDRQPGAAAAAGPRDLHQALQRLPRRRERPHPRGAVELTPHGRPRRRAWTTRSARRSCRRSSRSRTARRSPWRRSATASAPRSAC